MLRIRADELDRNGEPWTPEEDALLGTDTDRAIAAKLLRSSVAVGSRRTKLGIARHGNNPIHLQEGL